MVKPETGTYNNINWKRTTNALCSDMGLDYYIPITVNHTASLEKYCPHFEKLADVKKYIREVGTLTSTSLTYKSGSAA